MSRAENRARLLRFLETIRRPDHGLSDIGEEENLVQSGLIDSLALLEIVSFLEAEFGIDFAATGLDPARLTTIPSILDLIETRSG
jgi:acyl carrier protein